MAVAYKSTKAELKPNIHYSVAMDATYPSAGSDEYANKAAQTNDDGVIHDESAYVVALQPPAPASAHERAAWRIHDETVSGNLGVVPGRPQAPQLEGLSVITTLDRASVTAESDYHDGSIFGDWTSESSSLPSPNTSTPGLLHTPVDSPTQVHNSKDSDEQLNAHPESPSRERATQAHRSSRPNRRGDAAVEMQQLPPRSLFTQPSAKSQGYSVRIDFQEEEEEDSWTTYELLVDTGLDETFVFGDGLLLVDSKSKNLNTGMRGRIEWPNTDSAEATSHSFIHRGPFDPKLSNDVLGTKGKTAEIDFADGCVAQMGLLQPRMCKIYCYDHRQKERARIDLTWQFGAAFAVDSVLINDPNDGILGLGLTDFQMAYKSSQNDWCPRSFLEAMRSRLRRVSGSRPEETIALYFAIRMAPLYYQQTRQLQYEQLGVPIQSWMSFNRWPCSKEPQWNEDKIVVYGAGPVAYTKQWAVYLRSIRFYPLDPTVHRPQLDTSLMPVYGAMLNFVDNNSPRGLKVLLDTGASISRLPLQYIQQINRELCMQKNTINPVRDGIPRETYEISHHVDNQDLKIQVLYEFEGANGSVVKVYGPFETCFYQRHNGRNEALIFPQRPSRTYGVFGLNFFQSMYISLHKTLDSGANFVRMAAQWPENFEADLQGYNVPGLSAT